MDENTTMINEVGEVKIAPEVVNIIASLAATEVKGVAGMSGGFTDDIAEKFGMKSSNKGIKVQLGEEEVVIDLFLILEYGFRIPEVAWEVQQNVKKAVETMTGLKVVEVNIHVQGINILKEQKEEETVKKTK
ncbi:Uncharacterized conserved protein YloU, alkaline shock protein (Asp23) family [Caloramator quimbayensis]|uniref:Uncharacterized conserved protein YloU, alkaline shock protein (Asp23) family n=1 Tax=Caloramator quimbayensis TaxID=1147123 RepID=A0A1T4WZE7_9CLOT|nr:Asp23/Gls24 family envelope stress response protein [Caloramator quimbayensis]SKA81971.1 Uncharacterized conserved protein YloU, alkaline shock protein (Asp23) family [Caloramator quimbayensis]